MEGSPFSWLSAAVWGVALKLTSNEFSSARRASFRRGKAGNWTNGILFLKEQELALLGRTNRQEDFERFLPAIARGLIVFFPMLAAFFTTFFFAWSAMFGTRAARALGGTLAHLLRMILAAVLLGICAHAFGLGLGGASLWMFLFSGMIGYGLGDFAYFQSMPRVGARLAVLLVQCGAAPIGAIIEWFWLGTTLSASAWLCSITILTGVSLALAPSQNLHIPARQLVTGIVFGVLAALGQGLGAVLSRKAFQIAALAGEDPDGITSAYQRVLGGLLVISIIYLFKYTPLSRMQKLVPEKESGTPGARGTRAHAFLMVAGNAIFGAVIGVSLFQYALKSAPTGIVLSIVATTPIVIIPFARIVDGENISRRSLFGSVIAVAGVAGFFLFGR
jgi:drug/metabolite transporter (DMT)-like permease